MAKQHGKDTVVIVGANNLSQYVNASELTEGADNHDNTTYGNNSHRYDGGLGDSEFSMSGKYDTTAGTGPRAVLKPLKGQKAVITYRPEGTGSGKAQDLFTAVLTSYVQTAPVADYVSWSTKWVVDGDVDATPQP